MDSDEEETFVSLGNPVEQIEHDAPLKKPILVQDLTVKDKKGRQRFHGAFTGGFSAGYFNTVGSKDGFEPAQFVSIRDQKNESVGRKPEDFMDDEDFSEHGIAPRRLVTSEKFSTEERKKRRYDEGKAIMTGTVFEGTSALTDFIIPEKLTIGVKLLKKMGWKHGSGIGSQKKTISEPGEKIYGCSLPLQEEEESDEDLQLGPKDVNPISFVAKDDVHGLGYSGLDPRSALPGSHINLFQPPAITKSGRKGIRGQAFGVGALEDPDDDVYSTDHMSNYDMTMELEDTSDLHGWTAPQSKHESKNLAIGYVGKVLEGFKLSDHPLHQKKVFSPPELPRNFKPVHVFLKPSDTETAYGGKRNAVTRGIALGEVGSVFDLVSSKDKDKMNRVKKGEDVLRHSEISSKETFLHQIPAKHSDQWLVPVNTDSIQQSQGRGHSGSPLVQKGSLAFKPFSKDERKQERYERYLSLVKQGAKDAYEEVTEGHMTEWERDHEKEEFIKAGKMYKPLSGMIASRFTRAKFDDADDTVDVPAEEGGDKDDKMKASEMKMYGKLTREEFKWYPDKLLCRRFNVADPYPGSSIVGLPTVKKDKFSVFNFLTFPSSTQDSPDHTEESLTISSALQSPRHENKQKESSQDQSAKSRVTSVSSKPVSIFSHLVGTEKRSASAGKSKEGDKEKSKSIFSHLTDDKKVENPETQTDREEVVLGDQASDNNENTAVGKPPMDLFSAIFGNTDSEDSDDEEKEQNAEPLNTKNVSSMQDIGKKDIATKEQQFLPGGPVAIETIEERLSPKVEEILSPKEESFAYGPMPPQSSASKSIAKSSLLSSSEYLDPGGHRKQSIGNFVDPSVIQDKRKGDSEEHRKHKHSKHKHKKEKKSKHKKSKHKKKNKKKKKKYSDSEDSSSDDSDIPTNKELLQKLRSLPTGKYL